MAKLFSVKIKVEGAAKPFDAAAHLASGHSVLALSESHEALKAIVGNLAPNQVIKFMSNGAWSMHELLEYILTKTGPARVYISTWTITENPARALLKLKEQNLITELNCIFDYRVKERAAKAFQLLSFTSDRMVLTKCHAKVTVIENEEWGVSIVGSANYSRNPRLEAGTIFTSKPDAIFDRIWMEGVLNGGK